MVLQLLVGVPLEMVHGATRIGLVYAAGVVAGRLVGPNGEPPAGRSLILICAPTRLLSISVGGGGVRKKN